MQSNELIELAKHVQEQRAEAQTIEVKSAHGGCPSKLYDTLSSFSNQDSGGVILFGLDEKSGFAAVGVYDIQDLQKQISEQCKQMCPPVRAVFTSAEYGNVYICAAEIPALDVSERPCYYSGKGRQSGSYIRVGDADEQMSDYEIYSYEAFRRHVQDDVRVVERAKISLMDQDSLLRYVLEKKKDKPQFSQFSQEDIYEMLNVTRDGAATLAAVMMFAPFPQGFFPQLAVTAVVVPGTTIGDIDSDGARFTNNRRIEGNLPTMFNEAMSFCVRSMKVKTIIDPSTGVRRDETEYPIAAIREILLNALIHRDYSVHTEGTPIQVDFFSDRLEVHSPGGLYGRLTVDQLGHCRPDCRNPALATMAETLTEAENRYSGIPTIRRAMKEAGLPEPIFINRRNEFIVVLKNSSETVPALVHADMQSVNNSNELLEFCAIPRSRDEITEFLGIKTVYHAMVRYIRPLIASGQLAMTIPDKPKSKNQKYFKNI